MKKLFIVIFSFFLFECHQDGVEEKVLSEIVLTSSTGSKLDIGGTTQLSAEGFDQFNAPIPITTINWSAENNIVTVDQEGLVTANTIGNSDVTAESEGIQAAISIKVWDSTAPRTEIYVSDVGVNRNGPHQILLYDENGQDGEVFISEALNRPQDIVFLESLNIVIVSNFGSGNIAKYDITTGAYLGTFASALNSPTRLEIGPDRMLYVAQWSGGPVKRYTTDGTFVDDFTSTSVYQAIGLAWDGNENLYVSSFNDGANGYVKKFDTSGNDLGFFATTNLSGPTDIWFDGLGNLLVNDWSANRVEKFSPDGSNVGHFITGLSQPEGVAFLNGNILLGNSGTGSVKMFDNTGAFIKDIVVPGAGGLKTTNAVTIRRVNY